MGDIKDILGISRSAAPAAPRAKQPTIKKPKGMSREVFALLVADSQSSGVPLAPTDAPDEVLKAKRTHIIGWEWRRFHNSGRTDGMKLGHWQKNNDKSTECAPRRRAQIPPRPSPHRRPPRPRAATRSRASTRR